MRKEILDHGYIELIESWGSDERIIESARMSTGKGFNGWGPIHEITCQLRDNLASPDCTCSPKGGDEKLLEFLWKMKHHTPFEMAGMIVEVKAPIMVFREWHRHRVQFFNEMSGRYTALPNDNYVPTIERLMIGSDGKNKQAGTIAGAGVLTEEDAQEFRRKLSNMYFQQEELYQWALKTGVPKELARVHIGVGRYSRMRAGASLRNWLAFLTLRSDHHPQGSAAQNEIRQFANALGDILSEKFPRTFALFKEFK